MKSCILSRLALLHPKNWGEESRKYPQLWYCYPGRKNKKIKKFVRWLCGKTGGHELSKTEWGYGGGEFADCWCRWCNELVQVQKTIVMFKHKDVNAKSLMEQVQPDR